MKRSSLAASAPPLATFALGVVLAELAIRALDVSPLILPRPSAVFAAGTSEAGQLLSALGATARAVLAGLLLSSTLGVAAAVALAASPFMKRAFYPYAIFFQIVPIVAIAPLLVIWFGAAILSKVLICALIVFFPVLINTVVGIRSVEPELRDLMRSLKATRWQTFVNLEVPAGLPVLLGGLKIGATLSVIGAVVGEFVGANAGLGFLINVGNGLYDTPLMFVAVFALVAIALGLYGLVAVLERWLVK